MRSQIADSLNLVVHLSRRLGQRRVTEMVAIAGYASDGDRYELETLYAG